MRLGEPMPAPLLASLLPLGIGLFAVAGFTVVAIELAILDLEPTGAWSRDSAEFRHPPNLDGSYVV